MIIGILLILVAVVLLGFGLSDGSSALLASSVAVSLLTVIISVVRTRQH